MNISKEIRRACPAWEWAAYLLLAAAVGVIPAVSIRIRGSLIDGAAAGAVGGGSHRFFWLLALFCALQLLGRAGGALRLRLVERRRIRSAARLDALRLEKASRVAFSVTETQRFHALWQQASRAAELNGQIDQAAGDVTGLSVRLLASVFVLWSIDRWTAVGTVLLLAVGVLLNRRAAKRTDKFWARYIDNMRRSDYFSSLLLQREYAAERKLFSFDAAIGSRYEAAFSGARRENAKLGRGRLRAESAIQVLFACYCVAAALLLLRPLLSGDIAIGLFTSAFYAAVGLRQSCDQICDSVYTLVGSRKQMEGFFAFLELEEETAAQPLPAGGLNEGIAFCDVSFTYPGADRPVLEHVSFRLEPGRHYALVGENGCGKSTLVKLLVGLYTPDSGTISVDGRPVRSLAPEQRRQLFSVVFQDYYRYPLTIRESASLYAPAPLGDDVLDAVFDRLKFHPMAAGREKGYDSDLMPLYQAGAGLSGGEWQKLAVARCVLSDAPVAVLDEPNAALDSVAEAAIYRVYREMLAHRTTLFISHRLGSVRTADEILVLRDGALLAKEPHEELMRSCAYYAELFTTQKGLYHGA